jgi:4-hydroxybenzoate polyprenyltransferase
MSDPTANCRSISGIGVKKTQLILKRIAPMLPANFAYWTVMLLGVAYELRSVQITRNIVVAFLLAMVGHMLTLWGAWFWNDIFDKETDEHTNADRPTTKGEITDREGLVLTGIFYGTGLLLVFPLGWYATASLFGWVLVNTLYSPPPIRFKSHVLTYLFVIGWLSGTSFLLGSAIIAGSPSEATLMMTFAIVLIAMFGVSYKDLKDAAHDQKSDADNLVVRLGRGTVSRLLMFLLPVIYAVGPLYFGLIEILPLSLLLSLAAVYVLRDRCRTDSYKQLVLDLDTLNGLFVLGLAVGLMVFS